MCADLMNPGTFYPQQSSPKSFIITEKLLEDFYCSEYYRHGWGQRYLNFPHLMPWWFLSHPHAHLCIHLPTLSLCCMFFFAGHQCKGFQSLNHCVLRGLDLTTFGSREKHLNLLSHGGVLISWIWEHFIRNKML